MPEGYSLRPGRARPAFSVFEAEGTRSPYGHVTNIYRRGSAAYNELLSSITRGYSTMRILEEALTFDDVLLVPAYSNFLPRDADLSTQLTLSLIHI